MIRLKLIAIIILVVVCTVCTTSCAVSANDIPSDLVARLAMLYPEGAGDNIMYQDIAEEYDEGFLSKEDLTYLYCSEDSTESAEEALLMSDGWAIMLSRGTELFEIHVFRARGLADTDVIAKLLYRRVRMFRSYDFYSAIAGENDNTNLIGGDRLFGGYSYSESKVYKNTPYIAANSLVYIKGNYIFLLATPDNESAIIWIENNVSG